MMIIRNQSKFNFGEVSHAFAIDCKNQVYNNSLKSAENVIIQEDGSLKNRGAIKLIANYNNLIITNKNFKAFFIKITKDISISIYTTLSEIYVCFYNVKTFNHEFKELRWDNIFQNSSIIHLTEKQLKDLEIFDTYDYIIISIKNQYVTYINKSKIQNLEKLIVLLYALSNNVANFIEFAEKELDTLKEDTLKEDTLKENTAAIKKQEKKIKELKTIQKEVDTIDLAEYIHIEKDKKASCIVIFNDRLWGFNLNGNANEIIASSIANYFIQENSQSFNSPFQAGNESQNNKSLGFLYFSTFEKEQLNLLMEGFEFETSIYESYEQIMWSISNTRCIFFANKQGVFSIRAVNRHKIMSSGNLKVIQENMIGASYIQPILLHQMLIYVSYDRKKIYSISLEHTDLTQSETNEITYFCSSLFNETFIKKIFLDAEDVIWVLLENDTIVTITINKLAESIGATRQVFHTDVTILDLMQNNKEIYILANIKNQIGLICGIVTSNINKDFTLYNYPITLVTNNYLHDGQGNFLFDKEAIVQEIGLYAKAEDPKKFTSVKLNDLDSNISFTQEIRHSYATVRYKIRMQISYIGDLNLKFEFQATTNFHIYGIYCMFNISEKYI